MNEVVTLNGILNTDEVNAQVEIVSNVMNKSIDDCAPIVTREIVLPSAPWITEDIKKSMKERDALQRNLKHDKYNDDLRVKSVIDDGRKTHYRDKFNKNKNDISASWKTVKKMLYDNNNNNKLGFITESKENLIAKAEKFNKYFANVRKKKIMKKRRRNF